MKKQYTSPMLSVISVRVERGYAVSGDPISVNVSSFFDGSNQAGETRTRSSNWTLDSRGEGTDADENFWETTYE